jgi:hypothetical protein
MPLEKMLEKLKELARQEGRAKASRNAANFIFFILY